MKIKGWVYVISNRAMPGIIKVGYSTKDPALRAQELSHTGSPHPYSVQYETLVWDPYSLEQRVHKMLYSKLEGKEWFRCTIEEAIAAIRAAYTDCFIFENYVGVEQQSLELVQKPDVEPTPATPSLAPRDALIHRATDADLEAHEKLMSELDKEVRETAAWRTWGKIP
jgi:hypothetical protein